MPTEPVLHRSPGDRLDPPTLYALLRLRVGVFVAEQASPYQDLDGLDLEPSTIHFWLAPPAEPVAVLGCLRLLRGPAGNRIGRVCISPAARGRGLAGTLMRAALDEIGSEPCVLDAQAYLVDFYASFGFSVAGAEFVEDGIPHVPMHR